MTAVVRVKRLLEDEPLDAVVLSCKKRKTDLDEGNTVNESLSTVLNFAGTIKNQVCTYHNLKT